MLGLAGGGEHLEAERLAQLHEGRPGTMAGIGDQRSLPGLGACQVDVGEIGDQQRRVMHAGLDRRKQVRIAGNGGARQHDNVTIHRVIVGTGGREAGDPVAYCDVIDAFADRRHHTGHLVADPRGQTGL